MFSNRDYDHADRLADLERTAGVHDATSALRAPGRTHCRDCNDPIEAFRRAALPSADRCVDCQSEHESKA
jgi:phage/conjugal plasmid C-4 type zinc finger TraR family protein